MLGQNINDQTKAEQIIGERCQKMLIGQIGIKSFQIGEQ